MSNEEINQLSYPAVPGGSVKIYDNFKDAFYSLYLEEVDEEFTKKVAFKGDWDHIIGTLEEPRFQYINGKRQTAIKLGQQFIKVIPFLGGNEGNVIDLPKYTTPVRFYVIATNKEGNDPKVVYDFDITKTGIRIDSDTYEFRFRILEEYVSNLPKVKYTKADIEFLDPEKLDDKTTFIVRYNEIEDKLTLIDKGYDSNRNFHINLLPIIVELGDAPDTFGIYGSDYDEEKVGDIAKKFIPDTKEVTEDELKAARDFLISQITHNPNLDCGILMYDFRNDKIKPIEQFYETNTRNPDEFSIVGALFPKYGAENVNWNRIEDYEKIGVMEDLGYSGYDLPKITEQDMQNLKICGVDPGLTNMIISSGHESVTAAIVRKLQAESLLEQKADEYNAPYDPNDEKSYILKKEELGAKTDIKEAEKFMLDIKRQLASFKLMSLRVKDKVDNGEFVNQYMSMCAAQLVKTLRDEEKVPNGSGISIFGDFINKIVKYAKLDGIKEELVESFENTSSMHALPIREKSGLEHPSLYRAYSNLANGLVFTGDLSRDIPVEQEASELVNRVIARLEYLQACSREPIQLLSHVYPIIADTLRGDGDSPDEPTTYHSEAYINIGFDKNDITHETRIKRVDSIVKRLENLKKRIDCATDEGKDFAKKLEASLENANKYIASVGDVGTNKRLKNRTDKLACFARYSVLLEMFGYVNPIITGRAEISSEEYNSLEDKSTVKIFDKNSNFELPKLSDYDKLEAKDKAKYVITRALTPKEDNALRLDFILKTTAIIVLLNGISRVAREYEKNAEEVISVEKHADWQASDMFTSSLTLFISVLKIIETVNISKIKTDTPEQFSNEISKTISDEQRAKLGKTAIDVVTKALDSEESVKKARTFHIDCSFDFFDIVLDIIEEVYGE